MPGSYSVRVTVNGANPKRNRFISPKIRARRRRQPTCRRNSIWRCRFATKLSAANQAVINVRKIRDQVNDRLGKTQAADLHSAGDALNKKLTGVEEAIYQVKNRSGQDPLNFPIKLNNRIGHLLGVIEGWQDARPTDQTYTIFKQLSAELDAQLAILKAAESGDLAAFNKQLVAANLQSVALE